MEIAKQLGGMIDVQWLAYFLALDEDLYLSCLHDCVVNFLPFLRSNIANEFRCHFRRIKNIVAQYRADKGHDKSILGRFFRLNGSALQTNFGSETC
ncbi:hypothetical protein D3C86_1740670 [compost metagenome]